MNDHHFSYPVVVPLEGVTISGHSSPPPAPVAALQTIRPVQALVPPAAEVAPVPRSAGLALAS
jgi:hypothetical protein